MDVASAKYYLVILKVRKIILKEVGRVRLFFS